MDMNEVTQVNFERIYRTGDRITLISGAQQYETRVDEVTSPESLTVLQPWALGQRFTTSVGAVYKTVCATGTGVHYCTMETIGVDMSARVRTVHLKYMGKYYRAQNRGAYRCQVTLPVEVRLRSQTGEDEGRWRNTRTMDISATGARLLMGPEFVTGSVIELRIFLNRFGMSAMLPDVTGMVVHSQPTEGSRGTICGVQFTDIDHKASDTLAKFVILCQRNARALGR